jgi:hypothetical protein
MSQHDRIGIARNAVVLNVGNVPQYLAYLHRGMQILHDDHSSRKRARRLQSGWP